MSALPLLHTGKVRELYDLNGDLLMVASDRISTYDVVHPTPIPDKGKVLTGLSVLWFGLTRDIVAYARTEWSPTARAFVGLLNIGPPVARPRGAVVMRL